MPGNFLRETPAELEQRVLQEADILRAFVYALQTPDMSTVPRADMEFVSELGYDFVNGDSGAQTPEEYVQRFHELEQGVR